MKVITILGLVDKSAEYKYGEMLSKSYSLKTSSYENMLPLLMDNFGKQNVVPIYTKLAKDKQVKVLEDRFGSKCEDMFDDRNFIENENNFYEILSIINNATSGDDEYIVDLTHGFRHMPILATISLIAQSVGNTEKIRHIFFAKEVEQYKVYEIIDLKEFLELANMSYMLEIFIKNYTISSAIYDFKNENFKDLRDSLWIFSNHLMSNSLKAFGLNLVKILESIESIRNNEEISIFKNSLEKIEKHIKELREIGKKEEHIKFYEMAKILNQNGYLLNAITLLFEATGHYCVERFRGFGKEVDEHISKYISMIDPNADDKKFSFYTLRLQSRNFVKKNIDNDGNEFKEIYLFNPETLGWSPSKLNNTKGDKKPRKKINKIHSILKNTMLGIENIVEFKNLIISAEKFRNNLTHGNSESKIDNSKQELKILLDNYKKLCIDQDILRVK
ncbi:TM1812 family CRISPR-associated protein [Campylobacter sp. RM13119]|uniref:TM1812 family CRISPR-associated protein n=1 Tax=Campylobacter californiensis TaxID=1032243 RepID=UPI0014758E57|nr:TM1812 family CRISPR-associated protein [Campylobacter sp. RM13119]MBE3606708.1 TM1812 family CRISPR-associated protein [Campylobacter sp. RM13119]